MAYYYAMKNYERTLDLITSVFQCQSLIDGFLRQLPKIQSSSSIWRQRIVMTLFLLGRKQWFGEKNTTLELFSFRFNGFESGSPAFHFSVLLNLLFFFFVWMLSFMRQSTQANPNPPPSPTAVLSSKNPARAIGPSPALINSSGMRGERLWNKAMVRVFLTI